MVNTTMQALGWVFGLLAWGAAIGMINAENWRVSNLHGDKGTVVDLQVRMEGLWSTCNLFPSGQYHCSMLPIEIGEVRNVILACRALMILAILFGALGGLMILVSFKCVTHGPQEIKHKATIGRYGGLVFLVCGFSVIAAASWHIADVYNSMPIPDARGNPISWKNGEAVQILLAGGILWIISGIGVIYGSRHNDDTIKYKHQALDTKFQEYI